MAKAKAEQDEKQALLDAAKAKSGPAASTASKEENEEGRKVRRAFVKAVKKLDVLSSPCPVTEAEMEVFKTKASNDVLRSIAGSVDKAAFLAALQAAMSGAAPAKVTLADDFKEPTAPSEKIAVTATTTSSAALAPAEWTVEENLLLVKAASKQFPPGTQGNRWALIAGYLSTHCRTSWTRSDKDIAAKVNALKDVKGNVDAKKGTDSFEAFTKGKAAQKDKSKPAESVPSERYLSAAEIAAESLSLMEGRGED